MFGAFMSDTTAYISYKGAEYPLLMLKLDESLNDGIHAEFETVIPFEVNAQTWLGRLVRIQCQVNNSTRLFPLTVTSIEVFAESVEGVSVRLMCESEIALLKYSHGMSAMKNNTVETAIQALLAKNDFDDFQRQWHSYKNDDVLLNRIQHPNETDEHFFRRLLSEHGITVQSFIDDAGEERFLLSNSQGDFKTCLKETMGIIDSKDTINASGFLTLHECSEIGSTAFSISTLSPDNASIISCELPNNNDDIPTLMESHLVGHTQSHKVNMNTLLQKKAMHNSSRFFLKGTSNEPLMQAGKRFNLDTPEWDHIQAGAYLITRVHHEFTSSTKTKNARYTNEVRAIPGGELFIPKAQDKIQTHAFTAQLEGDNKVPTLFDHKFQTRVHGTNQEALSPITQLQPFVGSNNSGWHQPLLGSSALVLNTAFNEPDSIYSLGSFSTDNRPSVVDNQSNIGSHAFVSHSGHRMEFNTLADTQTSNINTNDNNQSLQYKISSSEKSLHLSSQNSSVTKTIEGNLALNTQSSLKEFMNTQQLNITGDYLIETLEGNMTSQIAELHSDTVKGTHVTQAGQNLKLNIANDLTLKSKGNLTFHSTQGDMQLALHNGQLQLQTPGQLIISGDGQGDIHLTNKKSGILLSSQGDVTLYGETLAMNASSNLSLTGHVNYDDKGSAPTLNLPESIMPTLAYLDARPVHLAQTPATKAEVQFLGEGESETLNNRLVTLGNAEAIEVAGKKLSFPSNTIVTQSSDYQTVPQGHSTGIQANHKLLQSKQLFAPVIFNWNKQDTETLLTPEQLHYFKTQGNNAFIFIHGYDVGFGEFAQQINDIQLQGDQFDIDWSSKAQTILRSFNALEKQFPALYLGQSEGIAIPDSLQSSNEDHDALNGSEMHNWLLHIEDNLNRATGQFDGSDYTKYQRIIGIAWKGQIGGNLSALAFPWSEKNADDPILIERLSGLLLQLSTAKITINIMAHSLGSRVVLNALQHLGNKGKKNIVEHLFLWDAAVANNALSTDYSAPYFHAANVADKITVLYSQFDRVLEDAYSGDKFLGLQTLPKVHLGLESPIPRPALGHDGPDKTNNSIRELIKSGKIIPAPLTQWATHEGFSSTHSYMKIPSKDIMKHGYQQFIINQTYGLTSFGNYDGSKFPKGEQQ